MNNCAEESDGKPFDLPPALKELFWECDFTVLGWENHRDFIIGRVLASGSWDQITWLRGKAGDDSLREWILRRRGRQLTPAQLRLWELILDLPHDLVSGWLAAPERWVWDRRVHR